MKIQKDLLENATEVLEGPSVGSEAGLTALIIEAINGEWKTVDEYNTLAIMAKDSGYFEIAKVIEEINTEENVHIGQLQELLKKISPNANAIDDGAEHDSVDDDTSWYDGE